MDARLGIGLDRGLGRRQDDDRDPQTSESRICSIELRALDAALQERVHQDDVGASCWIAAAALCPLADHVEQLDPRLRVQQAADVLRDLRDVLDDQQPRLVARWHPGDDTTRPRTRTHPEVRAGWIPTEPSRTRPGIPAPIPPPGPSGADGDEDRPVRCPDRCGRGRSRRRASRRPDRPPRRTPEVVGRDEPHPVPADPATVGSPWPPSSKIVGDRDRRARGVVLRRTGLGDDGAGLGVQPRPLEDDPPVVAGKIVGVREPDVDDRDAARREMSRERSKRRRWAGRVGRTRSEFSARNASLKRAASGRREIDEIRLDEGQASRPPRFGVCATSGAGEHRRSMSTPVTS